MAAARRRAGRPGAGGRAMMLLAAMVATAAGTKLFGWAAAPVVGAALGLVEALRARLGRPGPGAPAGPGRVGRPALRTAACGALAGAAGWALLLLWGGRGTPVTGVAALIGDVAGGLPAALVVVFALALPAFLAGTAAGAVFAAADAAATARGPRDEPASKAADDRREEDR